MEKYIKEKTKQLKQVKQLKHLKRHKMTLQIAKKAGVQTKTKEELIIGNLNIFSDQFVPDEIFIKEDFKKIIKNTDDFNINGSGDQFMLIKGSTGTGKTVSFKYLLREIEADEKANIKCFYINCNDDFSSFQILRRLTGRQSLKVGDLKEELKQKYGDKKVIFVLDEISVLKDISEPENVLYFLSRNFPKAMIYCLTNFGEIMKKLDDSIASSFKHKETKWHSYESFELKSILDLYVEKAEINKIWYKENKDEFNRILNKIAKETSQNFLGDCRLALITLKEIVTRIEEKKIKKLSFEKIDFDDIFCLAEKDVELKRIKDLAPEKGQSDLLLMLGLFDIERITTRHLELFNKVLKSFDPMRNPISKATYFRYLNELKKEDYISEYEATIKKNKVGAKTKAVDILLKHVDLIYDVLKQKGWDITSLKKIKHETLMNHI